ncbi:MAG: four helix bundle protein, partial [Bdellovibrionia bacterium]
FRTYQLALSLHKECEKLHIASYLKDQFLRASSSVVLNLAEGSAKPTVKDRAKFYRIALGSLREVQAILDIVGNANLITRADEVGASVYKLCKSCA